MTNHKQASIKIAMFALVVCWLVGCQPASNVQVTITPTQEKTATITSTKVSTATTPALTNTPENTKTPAPTKVPTYAKQNIAQQIQQDLITNNDADLPAILGLTVNESSLYDKNNIMSRYPEMDEAGVVIEEVPFGMLQILQDQESEELNSVWIQYDFEFTEKRLTCSRFDLSYRKPDINPIYNNESFKSISSYYAINHILATYGPPSEVFVLTWSTTNDYLYSDIPFYLILYYAEEGFAIEYTTLATSHEDNFVSGNLSYAHIGIWAWDAEEKLVLNHYGQNKDICTYLGFMSHRNYQTLETATGMSIDDFYTWIQNADDDSYLLDTFEDVWGYID